MVKSLWQQYSEEELKKIYLESRTQKEFLEKIGYSSVNANVVNKLKATYNWYNWQNKETLVGKTFNSLFILKEATKIEIQKYRPSIIGQRGWWAECSCGKLLTYPISSYELQSGHTKSCGHNVYIHQDLTGQRFGRLVVVRPEINDKIGGYSYCHCDCGNFISVRNNSLKSGNTQSCGCLSSKGEERIKEILTKHEVDFVQQKTFKDLFGDTQKKFLSFDFYIPSKNLLIEYQGEQHYNSRWKGMEKFEKQRKYDERKRQYCKENNFFLKEVPYWDYDKITYEYLFSYNRRN